VIRFLLAQLHLDSLIGKRSPKAIRAALAMLPKGSKAYDQAFSEAMVRIESQIADSQELAKQALSWITCAKRPLTSREIQHALAVEINSSEFDDQNLTEIADVLDVCAGLVTVEGESEIVRLIHYTTQEYFERTWPSWFPNAQKNITETCLTYLSLDSFGSGFCLSDKEFEARLRDNPLYYYAARNWGHHAQEASTEARESILDFLGKETILSGSTQVMMAPEYPYPPGYSQNFPKQFTGVHLAGHFGLTDIISKLLETGHLPNTKDSWNRTPVSLAAKNGLAAVVALLTDRTDVDANFKDEKGQTPLSLAAEYGHESVLKLLLDRTDVDMNSKDQTGRTPLSRAAENGYEAVVKLLVDRADVDVNSRDQIGQAPLLWAAKNGYQAVVKLLVVRTDIDVNSRDRNDRTPLSLAARYGHEAVVKLLVNRINVDVSSKDQDGQTALSRAATHWHAKVVKLLVDRTDLDVNCKDQDGKTALLWAAERGHAEVIKLLVDRTDLAVNSKDQNGQPHSHGPRDTGTRRWSSS
jgi:ankyrin repeat protein